MTLASANIVSQFDWAVLPDRFTSDHYPIILTPINSVPQKCLPHYNVTKADWISFGSATSTIDEFQIHSSPQDNYEYLFNFITSVADKFIPKTRSQSHPRQVPWWSSELRDLVHLKHSLERSLRSHKNRIQTLRQTLTEYSSPHQYHSYIITVFRLLRLKPYYNSICAKFKRLAIIRKRESWQHYVNSLNAHSPLSSIWEKFHRITGCRRRPPIHALIDPSTNEVVYDTASIAQLHAQHQEQVSSTSSLSPDIRSVLQTSERPLDFSGGNLSSYNTPFTCHELSAALSTCGDSAPGPDDISYSFIRHSDPKLQNYLLALYNQFWTQDYFPPEWCHAHEIPIPKPGKDPFFPTSSRPISLTSCLCKLMEKLVAPRLVWFAEHNNLLSPSQSGSRKGRSTIHSLACLDEQIKWGFVNRHTTVAVFFDIVKAYDTTWRYHVLRTLHSAGIHGHLPKFLENFLSNRTFQVRIANTLSDIHTLQMGIPQGSVLSSTLFAIAINGVTSCLPTRVSHSLYVDDFAIYYTSSHLSHIQRILNIAITRITSWASSVGFQFSPEKTKAIIFYRNRRHLHNESINLYMGDVPISFHSSVRFLGIIFDTHLNWKSHIADLKARCN